MKDRLDEITRTRKWAHGKMLRSGSKVYRAFVDMEAAAGHRRRKRVTAPGVRVEAVAQKADGGVFGPFDAHPAGLAVGLAKRLADAAVEHERAAGQRQRRHGHRHRLAHGEALSTAQDLADQQVAAEIDDRGDGDQPDHRDPKGAHALHAAGGDLAGVVRRHRQRQSFIVLADSRGMAGTTNRNRAGRESIGLDGRRTQGLT